MILVTSVILGPVGSSNFTVLPGDFWRNPLVQTFKKRFESFFNVGQCNIRLHADIHPILYSENTRLTPEDGVILYRDQVLRGVWGVNVVPKS